MTKKAVSFWIRRLAGDRRFAASAALFAAALVIVAGAALTTSVTSARSQAVAPDAAPLAIPPVAKASNEFTRIAQMLEPSVVYITSEYRIRPTSQRRAPRQEEEGQDPGDSLIPGPFRRFFESPFGQMPAPRRPEGTGSGFIVDKNGYILTNLHVVDRATAIKVRLSGDRTEYKAKLIGSDPELDIAVIKIDAGRPLQPVKIANSDGVQVGEWAIAIGAPFELEKTVTVGIVSALGRDLATTQQFQRFIQTDAAINPGNSGGPLVNIRGEVIGVNTMIATNSGGYEGIGFALPINTVVKSYNQIIRSGRVVRGSIGIRFPRDEAQIENTLRALGFDHGIIVESVAPGGPAEKAGLLADDVILSLNGRPVKDGNDLVGRISEMPVGSEAALEIDRGGKRITKKVTIEERDKVFKDDLAALSGRRDMVDPDADKADESSARFGIGIRPLSEERRKQLGFPQAGGVEVTVVEEESFAEEIGMRTGDIIVSINRQPVAAFEDVKRIQSSLKRGDAVAFKVMRPMPGARGQRRWSGAYLSGVLPK